MQTPGYAPGQPAARFMPRFGEAILERREWLGLSGSEVAARSEVLARTDPALYAKFSQQTLSRWETDRTGRAIAASSPARIRALAHILQWTVAEFERNVGVPIGGTYAVADSQPIEIPGGLVLVPIVGLVNGGKPAMYGVPVAPEFVRGNNTRAFQVQGNSMEKPDGGIRDGSWVLVDISVTQPVSGRVFLLEILGDGFTVKRLRRVGDEWVFLSDNPAAEEVWRADQVRIIGVVYGTVAYTDVH
jgi:repressor LexA